MRKKNTGTEKSLLKNKNRISADLSEDGKLSALTINERITGGTDDDILIGGAGRDIIRGEGGNDVVFGGQGDDFFLSGGAGNDTVKGGAGADLLAGGNGDDAIIGGIGADTLYGNQGADAFIYKNFQQSTIGSKDKILDFQADRDFLDFRDLGVSARDVKISGQNGLYTVSLKKGKSNFALDLQTTGGRVFTHQNILFAEGGGRVLGGAGADRLTGDTRKDLYGFGGDDRLDVSEGGGYHSLSGGAGDDLLIGKRYDYLYGGAGNDRLVSGGAGFNHLSGGAGDDVIRSAGVYDRIDAGAGDDIIHSFKTHTDIKGGAGYDTLYLTGKFADYQFETQGNDTVLTGLNGETHIISGVERLNFSDQLSADASGNSLIPEITSGGNPVTDWLMTTLNTIKNHRANPLIASRAMAIESVAVSDTLKGIAGESGYAVSVEAPDIISKEAAVASAAHRVLTTLFSAQKTVLDEAFAKTLNTITDGLAENNGVAYGQAVADQLLADRNLDGWDKVVTWENGTHAGQWSQTPALYAPALLPHWGSVKPFALSSGDQFRAPPPPALDSARYADQYNEVKSLGGAASTTRTQDQTEIALFWADGAGTYTPPGHWNEIAAEILMKDKAGLEESADLFATLNIALADAGIAAWDTKYAYNLWRPVTAITQGDTDGNPMTQGDVNWKPLIATPPFPEYVSGHSTFSGAAAEVLIEFLGDLAFSSMSVSLNRSFDSFTEALGEAGMSRIYGGIHFQEANLAGQNIGRSVGQNALAQTAII